MDEDTASKGNEFRFVLVGDREDVWRGRIEDWEERRRGRGGGSGCGRCRKEIIRSDAIEEEAELLVCRLLRGLFKNERFIRHLGQIHSNRKVVCVALSVVVIVSTPLFEAREK